MRRVIAAAAGGVGDVLRSPLLVAGALAITLLAAAPFAIVLGARLQEALADQPPIALGSGEIDADWWQEFRAHATGLAATFTPTVIGFAAPLDNLSTLLDGTRRPLVLIAPILVAMVTWAWFWGVALTRFRARQKLGWRAATAAGFANLPRFIVVSLVAAATQLVLYVTLHPLLFRVAYPAIVGPDASEPVALAVRVLFYVVFGVVIVTVSLAADYTRIAHVMDQPRTIGQMFQRGIVFVRRNYATVLVLFAMVGVLFVMLLVVYGAVEIYGGTRVRGWRGVVLAQGYILARLMIRLASAAAELRLFTVARG